MRMTREETALRELLETMRASAGLTDAALTGAGGSEELLSRIYRFILGQIKAPANYRVYAHTDYTEEDIAGEVMVKIIERGYLARLLTKTTTQEQICYLATICRSASVDAGREFQAKRHIHKRASEELLDHPTEMLYIHTELSLDGRPVELSGGVQTDRRVLNCDLAGRILTFVNERYNPFSTLSFLCLSMLGWVPRELEAMAAASGWSAAAEEAIRLARCDLGIAANRSVIDRVGESVMAGVGQFPAARRCAKHASNANSSVRRAVREVFYEDYAA